VDAQSGRHGTGTEKVGWRVPTSGLTDAREGGGYSFPLRRFSRTLPCLVASGPRDVGDGDVNLPSGLGFALRVAFFILILSCRQVCQVWGILVEGTLLGDRRAVIRWLGVIPLFTQ
jgi:hypothetical protein